MENNENFVEQTENVETTTEQTPKMFTQDEVNAIVGKNKARVEAKINKENDRKYGRLMGVLKAGTGKEDVDEIADAFADVFSKKGVKIPSMDDRTAADIEILGRADAESIIQGGYEDVVEEVDRLNRIGDKLTAREKVALGVLKENRQNAERSKALSEIGVTAEVYDSPEFKNFAKQFNPNIPIRDVYDIYEKTQPKKEIKNMGSMKSTAPDTGLKDFYSYEEASKFTKADFDKNPALYKRVVESMTKWK